MLGIAVALAAATNLRAAVTVSIESKSVAAGQNVLVGFFASSNSGDVLSGFNFPLDIGPSGQGFPPAISYGPTPLQNSAFDFTDLSTALNSTVNVDGVINGDGEGLALGPSPTKLFDLELAIAPSAVPGTIIPLVIVNPTTPVNLFSISGPNSPQVGSLQGGTLTIAGASNADFDGNGLVDGRDFLAWQRGFGIQTGATHQNGDANGDGAVAQSDLTAWRDQYGQHLVLPTAASVPEPAATTIAIACLFACAGAVRSHCMRVARAGS
jgi:hypothetical protein